MESAEGPVPGWFSEFVDSGGQFAQRGPCGGVAGRLQVGAQTQGGLGAGVGAVDDQPARRPHAVDDLGGAEPAQDVPLQRGDGQVHPGLEERGEVGVGVAEGGVAFAERHRVRASQ